MAQQPPRHPIHIGTAGWQVPKTLADRFPAKGTHLQRYSQVLNAVEVNSSFYEEHRPRTWAKWRRETPEGFRFAVKAPRWLTHKQELKNTEGLDAFLEEIGELKEKLGPILLQLPPSLTLDRDAMRPFFEELRDKHDDPIVCEPRNDTWFTPQGEEFLDNFQIARAAVDPSRNPSDGQPSGWDGLRYIRLHGYPKRFYSEYKESFLEDLGRRLEALAGHAETWCIFNNTACDGGVRNASQLSEALLT